MEWEHPAAGSRAHNIPWLSVSGFRGSVLSTEKNSVLRHSNMFHVRNGALSFCYRFVYINYYM